MNQCPTCGGEIWRNAKKNEQRAMEGKKPLPLFACKDKDGCGWVQWPPKGQGGGNAGKSAGGNGAGTARSSRPLGPLYFQCLGVAKSSLDKVLGAGKYSDTTLQAATATIFIAAKDTGAPVLPPPKPKPEPEPEQVPESEEDYQDDRDLPF